MIIKIALMVLMSLLLISCDKPQSIPTLVNEHVILADGINFDSGKLVVLNPFTGKQVLPCQNPMIKENNLSSQGALQSDSSQTEILNGPNCEIQVIEPNVYLENALINSNKVIEGTVLKNGKKIPARFFITVKAVYEGSYCSTLYGSGAQYDLCIKKFPHR